MRLRDLFSRSSGGGERPPAAEDATADDLNEYHREWVEKHGPMVDTGTKRGDATADMPYAKSETLEDRRVKQKAEFPWLYDPQRGVRWDFDPIELRNLAQGDTWVGMLIQSISKEIAETPWRIVRNDDRVETRKRRMTHPESRAPIAKQSGEVLPDATAEEIDDLLRRPNPADGWHDSVEMWMRDLLEVGSASVVKYFPESVYSGSGDEATLAVDASQVKPRALQTSAPEVWTKGFDGATGMPDSFYQFEYEKAPGSGDSGGGTAGSRGYRTPVPFDKDEVMWTDMSPASNRRYGLPPSLLVEDFLRSLDLAVKQEQQYLSRGSIPSGAWVFENYNRKELEDLKEEMLENVKGKPHKSLTFAGKGGNVSFEPMSMNFQELEFTDRMKWYARVVSSVFQVPTAVVGIEPEQINYSTFQGERENFEENTLGPYLQKLERFVNDELIYPHWGREYHFEFKPGISESTRQSKSERVRAEVQAGIITPNEAREETGREPVDESEADDLGGVENSEDPDAGPFGGVAASTSKQESFDDYPEAARENARMALEAREDTGNPNDCGQREGWARANQLANGEALSRETVGRMAAFDRHRDNSAMDDEEGRADCGWMMWKAWGGDEGIEWAQDKLDALEASAGGSGNPQEGATAKESLRNTSEWYQFDVQPEMVESLQEDIADDVEALFDEVLSSEEISATIERLATDDGGEAEKSAIDLARKLKDVLKQTRLSGRIADAIREHGAQAVRETLEETISAADGTEDPDPEAVDVQAVTSKLRDRDVGFADRYADQLADEIRETVADGWAEGKNSFEIREDIADMADIEEGWGGAERIARHELQIATGEARSEVAGDLNKVEVWNDSGDGRVRPAHAAMDGLWKRPGESWSVDYSTEGRGVQKESVPGDSEPGIGCRCTTLLRDIDEVDDDNHAGV